MSKPKNHRQYYGIGGILLLSLMLLFAVLLSMRLGSSNMSWREFFGGMFFESGFETQNIILYSLRLPRIFAAVLAGVGLSVSGVLLQGVTANPLASPNIIGVNSGAGFAVIVMLCFLPGAIYALPLAAFIGAFLATVLIVGVANKIGKTKQTVILAGIALTAMLNAGISFISMLDADALVNYNRFSVGGLSAVKLSSLAVPCAVILLSLLASLVLSRRINLLCLGDDMASSLGVNVHRLRIFCLVCASAAASSVVSFAGLLGFVGLVVPHIARRLVGENIKNLLVFSSFIGALLVVLADLAGRLLFAPTELPVGIVTALIGGPYFFFILLKGRKDNA